MLDFQYCYNNNLKSKLILHFFISNFLANFVLRKFAKNRVINDFLFTKHHK